MDFEEIKEQVREALSSYWERIQDSEIYIRLKERYDNLPPNAQKAIITGTCLFFAWFIYSIPASYVSSAQESLVQFEDDRQMIRELIRAGRIERTITQPPASPNPSALQAAVDQKMTAEKILPEQKASTTPLGDVAPKNLVPKSIKQQGLKATMSRLNLKQVVEFGESINSINGTKLMNIAIQADSKDPHYFNVDYEMAAFSVNMPKAPEDKKSKKKRKSRLRK